MDKFIKDRNEAFISGDEKKIKAYCKKYGIAIPEDEEIFWAGVHKAICNLFLNKDNEISMKQFNKSFDWLVDHGYNPSLDNNEAGDMNDEI